MRTFYLRIRDEGLRHRGALTSAAAHLVVLLCLAGGLGRGPQVVPYRLPGTAQGVTLLTYYSPGSARPVAAETTHKVREKTKPAIVRTPVASVPQVVPPATAGSQAGVGNAAQSGLGEGDITIALETYFPSPNPDLSGLPHGTKGDVILDAVVDEHGKISQLTLIKGLGGSVDEAVLATVRQWTYTPAMRQGVPVASERELHFHYERG
jgi:protein TonB